MWVDKYSSAAMAKFSQEIFDYFQQYINVYDCGHKYDGSPIHSISKETRDLFFCHKGGERNLTYN